MYILIIGVGAIGERVAESLTASGHEVFVLDVHQSNVERLRSRLGGIAAEGDGTHYAPLKAAGAERAHILIACMSDDANNLTACQLAKTFFHVKQTIAIVNSPENVPVFKDGGVDTVISTGDLVFSRLTSLLPTVPYIRLSPILHQGYDIVSVRVWSNSKTIGMSIGDLKLPENTKLLASVSRDGEMTTLSPKKVIELEDDLIAIVPSSDVEALADTINEPSEIE